MFTCGWPLNKLCFRVQLDKILPEKYSRKCCIPFFNIASCFFQTSIETISSLFVSNIAFFYDPEDICTKLIFIELQRLVVATYKLHSRKFTLRIQILQMNLFIIQEFLDRCLLKMKVDAMQTSRGSILHNYIIFIYLIIDR